MFYKTNTSLGRPLFCYLVFAKWHYLLFRAANDQEARAVSRTQVLFVSGLFTRERKWSAVIAREEVDDYVCCVSDELLVAEFVSSVDIYD